ncbi:DUF4129 domain-containing protein [Cellulomonas sp. FA1]|uniref:DUF4129 domain-containing protein n=1 Tax=Cellulomonas sp. FA1 TaxID=1346710 RepID=UPI0006265130|nr:DUF4129 domain-containing protein [Cellulomonas sp. FA1]
MPTRRASVVTALAALLVVVGVLGAALSGPLDLQARRVDVPVATFTPPPPPEVTEAPELADGTQETPEPPAWLPWLLRAVQAVALLAVVTVLVLVGRQLARGWRFDRRDDEDDEPLGDGETGELTESGVAALREGVATATRALEEDVPPGDAVVAAWVAVETAAARTGVERDRAQTASEFAVAVLGATRADPAATRALLGLYLAARFGSHPVTSDDVPRARDLLETVAQGLVLRGDGAGRPGGAGGSGGDGSADGAPGDARPGAPDDGTST